MLARGALRSSRDENRVDSSAAHWPERRSDIWHGRVPNRVPKLEILRDSKPDVWARNSRSDCVMRDSNPGPWVQRTETGSGGSSGFDSDSSPSCINCPTTRAPCPPTHHGRAPCPSAQPPSLGPDFTRLGARPKTGRVDPRDRLSPVVGPGHTREHSRLSPVVGPAPGHTREHSEHSGFSDAGYHSLAPSRSPTTSYTPSRSPTASFSTSSLDASTLGLAASSVWNVRATSDTFSSTSIKNKPGRSVTPVSSKTSRSLRPCPFDRLSEDLLVRVLSYLTSVDIVNVARTCKRLYMLAWEPDLWVNLSLTSANLETDRALKSILDILARNSGLGSVRSVRLNGSNRLTDRGLALLARRTTQLRQLEVQHCPGVTNGGLLDLVNRCALLNHLDLTGCPMVSTVSLPSPVSRSRPCPPLQYLDLSDCNAVDDTSVRLAVENCTQMQYLFLRRCTSVTDTSLKCVAAYCLQLRELSVSDCARVTDSGLNHLAKLGPSLRYLSVAKCHQLTDAGVKQLARHCYKLRYLNLRGCELISDLAVEAVARSCTRLRSLDIGKCDVTDLGLRDLSLNCPNLKKLSVRGCEMVGDQGLTSIAYYCRGLQHLNIQDVMGVTAEGYRNVKKFSRKCIIEHTNPGLA